MTSSIPSTTRGEGSSRRQHGVTAPTVDDALELHSNARTPNLARGGRVLKWIGTSALWGIAALATLLASPTVAAQADASAEESDADDARHCAAIHFGEGCWSLGLNGGYAIPFKFDDADTQVEESAFAALIPRGAVGLTDPFFGDAWYRGNIELGFEGHFLFQTTPHSGTAWGASLLLRYNFLAKERIVPFVEIGGSVIDLDFDLDSRADGFNFALQGGIGVHWFQWERAAITAQWRYHHISNGRVNEPNVSIDSSLFLIGTTFFLD